MASPWPPSRDADLDAAADLFAQGIAADPPSFGVDALLAGELVAAAADFRAKRRVALAPDTNSSVSVARKNESRKALLARMRRAAALVRAHPAGGDADKLKALGMVVPDRIRTRIAAPQERPALRVARIDRLAHELRVWPAEGPPAGGGSRSALPRGCAGYAIFRATLPPGATPPPDDAAAYRFEGIGTRPTFRLTYRGDEAGRRAAVFVRFLNRKGELGPPSDVATCTVAA